MSSLQQPLTGRLARAFQLICISLFLAGILTLEASASPIQRIEGVITEVGEGFLLLKPDGQSLERKFILRWKARFTPPKVPLKGDRVLILYKDKEDGAVIYGVNYVRSPVEKLPLQSDITEEEKRP